MSDKPTTEPIELTESERLGLQECELPHIERPPECGGRAISRISILVLRHGDGVAAANIKAFRGHGPVADEIVTTRDAVHAVVDRHLWATGVIGAPKVDMCAPDRSKPTWGDRAITILAAFGAIALIGVAVRAATWLSGN